MFLSRFFSTSAYSERGSSLIAVVATMAVTLVVSGTIAVVTYNALGTTTSTRASVQAQAAAEAGIDYAALSLNTATCAGTYTRSAVPVFSVKVAYGSSASGPWTLGCPSATSTHVRLVSTGWASNLGIAGNSIGDTRYVEAVYQYVPASSGIAATGSAVYSYGLSNNLNSLNLVGDGSGASPDVMIRDAGTEVLNCQNATVAGDVIIGTGNFQGAGGCLVKGNLSVGGTVALNSGAAVNGTVTSSSTGAGSYSTVVEGSSTKVGEDVVAGGPVRINGNVAGSVTSGPATGFASIFPSASRIGGSITVAGDISSDGAARCNSNDTWEDPGLNAAEACAIYQRGTSPALPAYLISGIAAPTAPSVPNWTDYTYTDGSDFTALGYNIVVWNNANTGCQIGSWNLSVLTAVSSSTTPTLVDARACTNGLTLRPGAVDLSSDVAFIAPGFSLGPAAYDSSDGTPRQLRFIVPDATGSNTAPNCGYSGSNCRVNIYGTLTMTSSVTGLIYTPGTIDNNNTTWRGQEYGKIVNFGTTIQLTYTPMGLPGVDFGGSAAAGSGGSTRSALGPRVSIRDLASAN